ncbi:competence/damage-inducible protein A [Agriterribacter sp.]|uniref:competence/damage-inducible protein A n=1 Tax=Agriterribacter sp. TaxID=2821509 RepID=UPI002BD1F4B5|nr:competence/damage-inducible protein A [Agriterribacter sp.]HRO48405.1 competence/damage-inducible protein A [Agriterribacter sp.]HRQ19297.1 competence/damage-inducible protein A [Agriterribacter sp.]
MMAQISDSFDDPLKINASIITIGDELLIGQVIDTNSAWIAQELNKTGIWLRRRVSVGDSKAEIIHALDEESRNAAIILITGGLGPTADDITKPVLCEYFGGSMVVDDGALANVKAIFAKLNRPVIERNLKQAEVPNNCTVIPNNRGTAPGMWFEKDGKIFVSMPGVPHEMKGMMTDYVIPHLQQHFTFPFIDHRTLLTFGIGESFLAEAIKDWEAQLPAHLKLAYLPNYGMVRLRITGSDNNSSRLQETLHIQFKKLKALVAEWLVADEDITLAQVTGRMLLQNKQTVATAESCTGGYIAHLITSVAGSSAWFKGSVVSYANEVKENVLGVQKGTLQLVGAVSEETVKQMVSGVMEKMQTDYAIATSGIMGPDGGTAGKPVGTVWIAAGSRNRIMTAIFHFRYDRARNIEMTSHYALNLLRKLMTDEGISLP